MKFFHFSASFQSQFLAAFAVNIISFGHGLVLGWLSPSLPLLQAHDSPLASGPLTIEQTSWVGSLICAGGIVGNYLYSFLSNRYGRKFALNLLAFPQICFWLTVIFGTTYNHLYIARIFAGTTGGGVFAAIPLFISEIAEPNVRGRLGSMLLLVLNVGTLISYTVGALVDYSTFPLIMIAVPIIFAAIVLFFPETPQSLVKKNELEKAAVSYRFYRGLKKDVALSKSQSEELNDILSTTLNPMTKSETSIKDFGSRAAISGILIGIMLMVLNQFSGGFVFINYSGPIFRDAGSSLSPNVSSIVIAILQIAGSYTATILIDKTGRKILLLISMSGITLGLGILGCFLYLVHHQYDVSAYAIIPVICLSFVIFIACVGILTVPFVILAEVLPANVRSAGTTISLTVLTACAFLVLKFFPILSINLKLYGCMWLFAGVCGVGTVLIVFFVPETKGKNLANVGIKEVLPSKVPT